MHCEGYSQKILWENAEPRIGMRKRGPAKKNLQTSGQGLSFVQWNFKPLSFEAEGGVISDKVIPPRIVTSATAEISTAKTDVCTDNGSILPMDLCKQQLRVRPEVDVDDLLPSSPFRFISPHPLGLTSLQSMFLDHYLNNFSLKYPTYLDPSNPFLSTLVPLALKNRTVLCAILAIGGIQTGLEGRPDVRAEILVLKGRVLRGCQVLLQHFHPSLYAEYQPARPQKESEGNTVCEQPGNDHVRDGDEEDDLMLFAGVMLLMVHDKLSGEPYSNLKPHLNFAQHFERRNHKKDARKVEFIPPLSAHYQFLRNIFLYNDLLASIASGSSTMQDYGQDIASPVSGVPDGSVDGERPSMFKLARNRYYLPILLSRIANGGHKVMLADIERWDGNMTWLPSFSSTGVVEAISVSERQPPSTSIADESEDRLISEIYRNAVKIFYFQRLRKHAEKVDENTTSTPFISMANYDSQIQHFNSILLTNLRSLPLGSAYESSLLFPIGIAAMEIHNTTEKTYVLTRLQLMEDRFQLYHFCTFREKLSAFWESSKSPFVGQHLACDAILLG